VHHRPTCRTHVHRQSNKGESERTETKPTHQNSEETTRTPHDPRPDSFGDFLACRSFATPFLVQLVFWAGTLAFIAWGAGLIAAADHAWRETDTVMVWAGFGVMLLGPAVLRIAGKLVMVVFRIHERLDTLGRATD
jgi:hypothetical protein